MTAFATVTLIAELDHGTNSKRILVSAVAPTTYVADGSGIDLSTWFTQVYSVKCAGRAIAGATAGAGYSFTYIPAASYAAASGKIIVGLIWQATPAESAGIDLSTTPGTVLFEVLGR